MHIGRGHTAGDVIAVVPDAGAVFAGDLVEYKSACYCGDAHFGDWPATLDHLAEMQAGCAGARPRRRADHAGAGGGGHRAHHRLSIDACTARCSESVAKGRSLKDAFDFARLAMDPTFKTLRALRALPAVQRRARL